MRRCLLSAILIGACLVACSPTFNWREVRVPGSDAALQFPCKPESRTRVAMLAGEAVTMTMVSCTAGGLTFALVHADLGDPVRVAPALTAMREALVANLDASQANAAPFPIAGTTPNPQALRLSVNGRMPDGAIAHEAAALFARDTRVYQAVVLGPRLDKQAVDTFFDNLRLPA